MIKNPSHLVDHLSGALEGNVQPNSIDLRINEVFVIGSGLVLWEDGRRKLPEYTKIEPSDGWFTLSPTELYQVEFMESIQVPSGVCGITLLRSTMFKSGASGESGLYDTGYRGGVGMTISVKHPVSIQQGARVAQILFFEAQESSQYRGYYQDGYEFKETTR